MSIRPKVLITDDEPVIADTLAKILSQGGFEAKAVYSGAEALELATTFAPDMLVTDVIMDGLNGIETAILMRKLLPSIKVLLFSGRAASNDLLSEAHAQGYEFELLAKPVHPKDLISKLRDNGVKPAAQETIPSGTAGAIGQQWVDVSPSGFPLDQTGSAGN